MRLGKLCHQYSQCHLACTVPLCPKCCPACRPRTPDHTRPTPLGRSSSASWRLPRTRTSWSRARRPSSLSRRSCACCRRRRRSTTRARVRAPRLSEPCSHQPAWLPHQACWRPTSTHATPHLTTHPHAHFLARALTPHTPRPTPLSPPPGTAPALHCAPERRAPRRRCRGHGREAGRGAR